MGWSVYSTHRDSPTETLEESVTLGRLDAIGALLVLVTWFAVSLVLDDDRLDFVGFGVGAGVAWLRRRLFPGTVIRFHRHNLALRCAAIFCGLASLFAVAHGFVARWLERSSSLVWSFFLTAGGLVALAVWSHVIEFRRRPGPTSEEAAEPSAGPGP